MNIKNLSKYISWIHRHTPENMMAIQIDTNSIHVENCEIYISTATVEFFHLKNGQKIYAYDGDCIWDAVIHRFTSGHKKLWYVELCKPCDPMYILPDDWNVVGYVNGICKGEQNERDRIIQRLISLGYSLEDIDRIVTLDEELKDKVEKILQSEE